MATSSRSLADDIRARTDAQLVDLVLARPDLARPSPADLTSLAARSGTRASVQRAVEALDRGHLQVLEALVVAGDGASVDELAALLGGADDVASSPRISATCGRSALVWRGADGEHVVRTVPEVLGSSIAGLGAPLHELRPDLASQRAEPRRSCGRRSTQAPADARAMLEKMTWGPALGVLPTASPGSHDGPLAHRAPPAAAGVGRPGRRCPARSGSCCARAACTAPPSSSRRTSHARPVSLVDAAAGGSASELLTQIDELAAMWGAEPPRVLRAGGVSVRDLRVTQHRARRHARAHRLRRRGGVCRRARRRRRRDRARCGPPPPRSTSGRSIEAGHRWATLALAWATTRRERRTSSGDAATGTGPGQRPRPRRAVAGDPRRATRRAARARHPRAGAAPPTSPRCATGSPGAGRAAPRPCSARPSRRCCARPSGSG